MEGVLFICSSLGPTRTPSHSPTLLSLHLPCSLADSGAGPTPVAVHLSAQHPAATWLLSSHNPDLASGGAQIVVSSPCQTRLPGPVLPHCGSSVRRMRWCSPVRKLCTKLHSRATHCQCQCSAVWEFHASPHRWTTCSCTPPLLHVLPPSVSSPRPSTRRGSPKSAGNLAWGSTYGAHCCRYDFEEHLDELNVQFKLLELSHGEAH
jgi:hypothetical protein